MFYWEHLLGNLYESYSFFNEISWRDMAWPIWYGYVILRAMELEINVAECKRISVSAWAVIGIKSLILHHGESRVYSLNSFSSLEYSV